MSTNFCLLISDSCRLTAWVYDTEDAIPADTNFVLRGRGRRHYVRDFPGPLSIKTVVRGSGMWRTAEGAFRVDETCFLILNEAQPYSLELDSREMVETCCVFFQKGFVESAWRHLIGGTGSLLDDPFAEPRRPLAYPAQLWMRPRPVSDRMQRIHQAGAEDNLDDELILLARDLAELHRQAHKEGARAPGVRPATREETYRRLRRARDYIHACYDRPLKLGEIARAACLSTYHFHRGFTRTFGETPHQYLARVRLARARQLLERGNLPVTEVCLESGFQSLGSFSSLFRRRFGVSPREMKRCVLH